MTSTLVKSLALVLRPSGVVLATVGGITPISRRITILAQKPGRGQGPPAP